MIRRLAFTTLAAASLLMTGCGDDGPTDVASTATFNMTVSGAVAATAQGPAHFGATTGEDGSPAFMLVLGGETSDHLVALFRAGSARPEVGTYEFSTPAQGNPPAGKWGGAYFVGEGDELLGLFGATSGTLTITESSNRKVKGTFQFTGDGLFGTDTDEPAQVMVTGSFDAAPAPL